MPRILQATSVLPGFAVAYAAAFLPAPLVLRALFGLFFVLPSLLFVGLANLFETWLGTPWAGAALSLAITGALLILGRNLLCSGSDRDLPVRGLGPLAILLGLAPLCAMLAQAWLGVGLKSIDHSTLAISNSGEVVAIKYPASSDSQQAIRSKGLRTLTHFCEQMLGQAPKHTRRMLKQERIKHARIRTIESYLSSMPPHGILHLIQDRDHRWRRILPLQTCQSFLHRTLPF